MYFVDASDNRIKIEVSTVNPLPVALSGGDIEIGSVELKDATSDNRAKIDASGNLYVKEEYSSATALISTPQTLTTSFADLGGEIDCKGYKTLWLWVKLTIQQSSGVQIKALAKHTASGTEEYNMPIETVSSTLISLNPQIFQLPDASDLYVVEIKVSNACPYIQWQVKMSTDGGTDGTIDTAHYTLG